MKPKLFILILLVYFVNAFQLSGIRPDGNGQENLSSLPEKIFAAQIHYSRIPYQYWEHRLQMIKAMGFNAVSVYVMWNFHEIQKGKFDFQKNEKNLKQFLQLTKKYGFYVLLRPGPFVCAEWDFGGLPVRLLGNKEIVFRSYNKAFLQQVKVYFEALAPLIKEHSQNSQGNIILLQIQNEYGYYGQDKEYIGALRQMWKDLNITVPQYYVDNYKNIDKSYWEGANIGINGAVKQEQYQQAKLKYPNSYIFGGEIYSGWLTRWGEPWQGKTDQVFQQEFKFLMTNNHSFSMYMAHGGTSFGLTAGADSANNQTFDYKPDITSYDYDAPINEQGSPTEKYHIFRDLAKKYATWQIPQVPPSHNVMEIPEFTPEKQADLFMNLPQATILKTEELITFEDQRLKMWNQGLVLYETQLETGFYVMNITVHDFALVYLDGKLIKTLDRNIKTHHLLTFFSTKQNSKLSILVQAMGHINFGHDMENDRKGIIELDTWKLPYSIAEAFQFKLIDKSCLKQKLFWNIYTIPIDDKLLKWNVTSDQLSFPRVFHCNITLNQTDDTYLNMEKWGKGYVFVNGYNLGRYWNKGPQKRLFLPGVWLKKGINDILVLQLLEGSSNVIKGQTSLKTEEQILEKQLLNFLINQSSNKVK